MWRDTPEAKCRGFGVLIELQLDYKRALLLCGPWAIGGVATQEFRVFLHKLQFAPVSYFALGMGHS